jgi:hypothetical protein
MQLSLKSSSSSKLLTVKAATVIANSQIFKRRLTSTSLIHQNFLRRRNNIMLTLKLMLNQLMSII